MQSALSIDLQAARDVLRLNERLLKIPPSAAVRGVWFGITDRHMKRLGQAAELAWRAAAYVTPRKPYKLYSVCDFLEELAIAGAITDPSNPAEGIRTIWRRNNDTFVNSLIGRSITRMVRPNPASALRWVERSRDLSCNYGHWSVESVDIGYSVLHVQNEYIWLDSAHRGGAEAMLDLCGVEGSVDVELLSDFDGKLHIRWRPSVSDA